MVAPLQDDEYEIPLLNQRFFGAGIKRKRVQFVPSTSTSTTPRTPGSQSAASTTVADRYRELVLKQENKTESPEPLTKRADDDEAKTLELAPSKIAECEVCHLPMKAKDSSHDTSIVHQFCLTHSHPPSSIDRRRKGLAVLQGQGWDPDARKGLGAEGDGILHPIKARDNTTRAGLGAKPELLKQKPKPVKLDAGKVRLLEKEGKKKADRLREAFNRSEDVLRYLGE